MSIAPRVLSIPSGAPFVETLVKACLEGSLGATFDRTSRDFSDAVIYVPTRRAARALSHAFADALQPRAVLLPRIVPLGDPDDLQDQAILADGPGAAANLPPAIPPLRRRLLLTQLVEAWRRSEDLRALREAGDGFSIGESFADSFAMAGDLARLIDEAHLEGASWADLDRLADGSFDAYWGQTRRFLEIAAEAWPAALAEAGLVDAADRRNRLLRAEVRRLAESLPGHPVIAAGSTGTVPATAELLGAIARLPAGAVVLPGLDKAMPDADWHEVADDGATAAGQPGHPQSALKRLLGRLGIRREDVVEIGERTPALAARTLIGALAMLPAESTDGWVAARRAVAADIAPALQDVSVIEAQDEREEALAIAVALREVLETEEKTAALVTPDRGLAERVVLELRRWGVIADDSAGAPLRNLPRAAMAGLVLRVVQEDFSPTSVMALLDCPVLAWTGDVALSEAAAALELTAFRGVVAGCGPAAMIAASAAAAARLNEPRARRAIKRQRPEAVAAGRALAEWLAGALGPLAERSPGVRPLSEWAALHAAALDALSGEQWAAGADGRALAGILDDMVAQGDGAVVTFGDYVAVLSAEVDAVAVPAPEPLQGRIKIWGLLEARLMHADRIVLGGLDEGVWPPQPRQDPFLNRAMRIAMGLALPERRIGQSAHDALQALGAPEVVIARARTVEGSPTVASRFLRRLDAFVGEDAAKAMRKRGERYVANARRLDEAERVPPAHRPEPKPARDLQPLSLSVTDIATLLRDPYAIYAREVLGLEPLDSLEVGLDASDRGNLVHDALARFVERADASWPEDPLATLLGIGDEVFAPHMHDERVAAFWRPMFDAAAAWFITERFRRRDSVAAAHAERSGRLTFALADGATFTLRGRSDLVERMTDGTLAVTDFKTGRLPGVYEVKEGLQPQLTLMAVMAEKGVFAGVPPAPVSEVRYIKIGRESFVRPIVFKAEESGLQATAQQHLAELKDMLDGLREGRVAWVSRRVVRKTEDVGDYDHLARVREWLGGDE